MFTRREHEQLRDRVWQPALPGHASLRQVRQNGM
jgi:hypothetical protein